ncbi:MAG TPA: hypothetical protein VGV64_04385 [Thermoplasmata archaeon]|nr:hypothetical protein [Thermoplasmata archaeon]
MTRSSVNLFAFDVLAYASFPIGLVVVAGILRLLGQFEVSEVFSLAGIATSGQSVFLAAFFDLPIGDPRSKRVLYPPEGAL